MSKIILDFGSGNTCKNDHTYIKYMYDRLKEIDHNIHDITIKWQLFERAGGNISLNSTSFDYAYKYGNELGYKVTASVFDKNSLDFLLKYDVSFVKIANNRFLDYLIPFIPEAIPVYISSSTPLWLPECKKRKNIKHLWCVSQYPADKKDYLAMNLKFGCCLSDHTIDFDLYKTLLPSVIEWHYKLKNSTGLDAGEFARTPEQLAEIL